LVDQCPNLERLDLHLDFVSVEEMKRGLNAGLKKLAIFKVTGEPVCLGTDWKGYRSWIDCERDDEME
jgi:hypothetical protein